MPTDFLITLSYEPQVIRLACSGELDIATAHKLRDAIELCIEEKPRILKIDTGGVSLITSSGIEVLVQAVHRCKEEGIRLDLAMSKAVRRVLDLIGLWWLGVLDDGPAIDAAFKQAMHAYSELHFDERLGQVDESEAV